MPALINNRIDFCFFLVAFLLSGWIALDTRRALTILFLSQKAIKEISDWRLRLLHILAWFGAVGLALVLGQYLFLRVITK
jgi:hypothetical protein